MTDIQTRQLLHDIAKSQNRLAQAIEAQAKAISSLANSVALLVEDGLDKDDEPDTDSQPAGYPLLSGKGN